MEVTGNIHADPPTLLEPIDFGGQADRTDTGVHDRPYLKLVSFYRILCPTSNLVSSFISYFVFFLFLKYELKDLLHAKGGAKSVDVHAIVKAFTSPRQTKRGDWMVEATLFDETTSDTFTLLVFRKNRYELPKLVSMGDVIRIHRAKLSVRRATAM